LGNSKSLDHYEAHITVVDADIDEFAKACRGLNLKPILIDAMLMRGGVFKDLMSSSKFHGTYEAARAYLTEKADALRERGFTVVREKLETTPFNPRTPSRANGMEVKVGPGYFETHVPVFVNKPSQFKWVETIAKLRGAHLSRNAFKRNGTWTTYMVTLRSHHDVYETFAERVSGLVRALNDLYLPVGTVITEFAIHDTHVDHDRDWTGAKPIVEDDDEQH
jgi:hypothetical protein